MHARTHATHARTWCIRVRRLALPPLAQGSFTSCSATISGFSRASSPWKPSQSARDCSRCSSPLQFQERNVSGVRAAAASASAAAAVVALLVAVAVLLLVVGVEAHGAVPFFLGGEPSSPPPLPFVGVTTG